MIQELTFYDEANDVRYRVVNDFMSYCYVPGQKPTPFKVLFPKCNINWNVGYIVKEDNTIVCSEQVNSYVASYDGCKESELSQIYNN